MDRRDFIKNSLFFTGSIFLFKNIHPIWKQTPFIGISGGREFYFRNYTGNCMFEDPRNWSLSETRKIVPKVMPGREDNVTLPGTLFDNTLIIKSSDTVICNTFTVKSNATLDLKGNIIGSGNFIVDYSKKTKKRRKRVA